MNTQSVLDSLHREWGRGSKKLGISLSYPDETNLAILRAAVAFWGEGAVKAKMLPLCNGCYWHKPQNERAQTLYAQLWPYETPPGLNGIPKAQLTIPKTVPTYQPKASQDLMSKLQEQFA